MIALVQPGRHPMLKAAGLGVGLMLASAALGVGLALLGGLPEDAADPQPAVTALAVWSGVALTHATLNAGMLAAGAFLA